MVQRKIQGTTKAKPNIQIFTRSSIDVKLLFRLANLLAKKENPKNPLKPV